MELTIKEQKYVTGRISGYKQFHIWRRIMPVVVAGGISLREVFKGMGPPPALKEGATDAEVAIAVANIEERAGDAMMKGFAPVIDVLSRMSDEDVDYVLKACLSVCHRQSGAAGGMAPVTAADGQLMFQDIGVKEMMSLSVAVIRENMGNFFDALPDLS